VERKGIAETATQTVGVPDAAEVEANEAIDNAEDVQSTNMIYQFNNCQNVYMNAFNARGLNISSTAPRNGHLEVNGKIEDIDDAANIRPTNAVYTKFFDNYNVTVKNFHDRDDQLLPPTAALDNSSRLLAPSEPPKTPPEPRRNNPFLTLPPSNHNTLNHNTANNWKVSSQTNLHPRHYPPEYPIPTDLSQDSPDINPKCLEHLLESALAIALVMQTSGISNSAEILTTRAQNTLKALNALVSVESPVSSTGTGTTTGDSSTRNKVTKWLRLPQLQIPKQYVWR